MSVAAVKINRVDLSSVVDGLKWTIEQIENGSLKNLAGCVVIVGWPDGKIATRGYGRRASPLEIDGWIARALRSEDAGPSEWNSYDAEPPGAGEANVDD